MQPEISLPYSQAPATCSYPEPTPSSPTIPSHFLKIHLNIILPSMSWSPQWSLSLSLSLSLSGFPTKTLCTTLHSSIRATCPNTSNTTRTRTCYLRFKICYHVDLCNQNYHLFFPFFPQLSHILGVWLDGNFF